MQLWSYEIDVHEEESAVGCLRNIMVAGQVFDSPMESPNTKLESVDTALPGFLDDLKKAC